MNKRGGIVGGVLKFFGVLFILVIIDSLFLNGMVLNYLRGLF